MRWGFDEYFTTPHISLIQNIKAVVLKVWPLNQEHQSASPRNLVEIQILQLHPTPTELETE